MNKSNKQSGQFRAYLTQPIETASIGKPLEQIKNKKLHKE